MQSRRRFGIRRCMKTVLKFFCRLIAQCNLQTVNVVRPQPFHPSETLSKLFDLGDAFGKPTDRKTASSPVIRRSGATVRYAVGSQLRGPPGSVMASVVLCPFRSHWNTMAAHLLNEYCLGPCPLRVQELFGCAAASLTDERGELLRDSLLYTFPESSSFFHHP